MTETIQQEPAKKIIVEFKHTDEQGNPLIDPRTGQQGFTNLTADTPEEMIEKQKEAYQNVLRALHRSRNHKPVPREPEPVRKELSVEEERLAVADLQDPTKARAAVRKLTGVDDLEARNAKLEEARNEALKNAAAYRFMSNHLADYYPCKANSDLISEFIIREELDPRIADNYEVAFNAVESRLAQRPAPPIAQPTPEPEPAPEPRKQAAGGIQPGELSGTRPIQRKKEYITKAEIAEMKKTPEGRAEFARRLRTDPKFGPAVDALFAKI